jgi:hypothetical protein
MSKPFIKIDFDPRVWGPKGWFYFETVVESLPDDIDDSLQIEIKNFFVINAKFLPCTFCTKHMLEYITTSKLRNLDFSRKQYVINWLNTLHNLRLDKSKQRTTNDVRQYYKHQYDVHNTNYTDLFFMFMAIVITTMTLKCLVKK